MSDSQWYHLHLCLSKYKINFNVYNFENRQFKMWFFYKYDLRFSTSGKDIWIILIKHMNLEKCIYPPHYWSDKGFKGTVRNRVYDSVIHHAYVSFKVKPQEWAGIGQTILYWTDLKYKSLNLFLKWFCILGYGWWWCRGSTRACTSQWWRTGRREWTSPRTWRRRGRRGTRRINQPRKRKRSRPKFFL